MADIGRFTRVQLIEADISVYIPDSCEIVAGVTLDIQLGGTLEIG